MSRNDDVTSQQETGLKPTESIRRASSKNILISVCVAAATYYSLTLIAKQFGGSLGSDAYFFLASLSNLAIGIIGSLIGTIFLPAFIQLLNQSDEAEAHNFASSIFSWCLVITCGVALPILVWNEQFFSYVSRFDTSQLSQISSALKYFAPIFLFGVLSEFFRVIALSIGQFTTAALSAFLPPFFLIAFLFAFGDAIHEEALIASLLAAKIIALIMLITVVGRKGIRIRFILINNQHTVRFVRSSAPYWSANVVTNAATFYFDYQASGLGAGVLTALAYANRIFMLPIVVFLTPIIEISRTKFSQMQSQGNYDAFNLYYNNLLRFSLYFSIPIAAFYLTFSSEIISAMFQRGAFQSENVIIAAECLKIYAWTIPIASIFIINGRACESYQRLLWPSIFGTIGNISLIFSAYYLSARFYYLGIPMSKVLIDLIYFLPFGFIAFQRFGGLPNWNMILRSALAAWFSASTTVGALFIFDLINIYSGEIISIYSVILRMFVFAILYCTTLLIVSSHVRREMKQFRFFINFKR